MSDSRPDVDTPPSAQPEVDPRVTSVQHLRSLGSLTRQNEKDWFPLMERTLEAHGVFCFLKARVEAQPILSPDSNNRDTVIAYQSGLMLACHLLETHCGPDAQACLVRSNPRASWRRLRRAYNVVEWKVGLMRMRHWMACTLEEEEKLGAWLRKMTILREQVLSLRRDDEGPSFSDTFCRDIILANLPSSVWKKLEVDRSETTYDQVIRQLKALAPGADQALAKNSSPAGTSEVEARAPSPIPSLTSDEAQVAEYYGYSAADYGPPEPFVAVPKPPFPILRLPPELLGAVLSLLVPSQTQVTTTHSSTLHLARHYQELRAKLRLVSKDFANALGPPTDFAIRNLTKLNDLIGFLSLHPERCHRIRNVVLRFRYSSRLSMEQFGVRKTLSALFRLCPNISTLHVRGTLMLGYDAEDLLDKERVPGNPRRPSKNEALLDAVAEHLNLTEFSYLEGDGHVTAKFLASQPRLTHLALSYFGPDSSIKIEPTILQLSIGDGYGPNCMKSLEELDHNGALSRIENLTIFDIQIPHEVIPIAGFISVLRAIAPRLKTFAFATPWLDSAPPTIFDSLIPLFTSIKTLTLPFRSYTSLSFISTLPLSCKTLVLLGPDIFSKWAYDDLNDHTLVEDLGAQLSLADARDAGPWEFGVVLCLQDLNGYGRKRYEMFRAQLERWLGNRYGYGEEGAGRRKRLFTGSQSIPQFREQVFSY
ncbi:hypothetical protein P7C70_g6988, partial [Phenoliferia sp. Uapishka_3]